jgi:alpha-D-ribose 1-methylphosphonate 5-triphosphate synthase subunit PhnL
MQKLQAPSSALAPKLEKSNVKNIEMQKRIGSTVYRVGVFFNEESRETFTDKVMRLARNDLNIPAIHGKMELPQTGRLLEGGSLL